MNILVLEGDGIGPEIVEATRLCLAALDDRHRLGLQLQEDAIGYRSLEERGTTFADEILDKARAADGVILGPVSHADYPPKERGGVNPSGALRLGLDLFANLRPSYLRKGIAATAVEMDLLIVRENTEGFYADRNMAAGTGEFMPTPDVALAMRKITRHASRQIARAAFEEAARRRRRVTIVHKANVLKLTDGVFLDECRKLAQDYPGIEVDDEHIDAMASLLVRDPGRFDVIVTTNMYGDILSNLAAELSGGLGLAESLNRGEHHAMAQASHGSAPEIAGRNAANPTAMILSAGLLLEWFGDRNGKAGYREAAAELKQAVLACLSDPALHTPDLGGAATTTGFTEAVIARFARQPSPTA